MTERVLRIFVSSPSDVAPERGRVTLVADRLNAELEGRVRLEVLRWEDAFYTAAHSFQEAIDGAIGNMSATDMVLCIVWKRAGLKLNPAIWQRPDGSAYESGTVLEFETAVEVSRKHNGVPDVFLFRKSAPVVYDAERVAEQLEQYQLLQAVWKRWTESAEGYNTAGYQSFADPDDFESKLEACLRQWLERRNVVATGPVWDRSTKGSPFRGLAAFEAAHAPVFFGRDSAIARATAKLRQTPFLLIIGASGSGKSSLLRAGLVPRVTAPGVIADVDLWRSAVMSVGGDPIAALADVLFGEQALGAELKAGDFNTPALLADLLASGGKAALAPVRAALARAAQSRKDVLHYDEVRPAKLLLALDQVERLFVEVEASRLDAFAGLLHDLVEAGLASLIIVLRSDTYGHFQAVAPFLTLLESHGATLDLLPPSPAALEEIVTRPVAACHPALSYETDAQGRSLAEVLVADARGGDALPLLQMTLQRLYDAQEKRGDGVLRFADYPGIDAAVARTAEEAVAGLDPRALAALPALITAFVRDVSVKSDGAIEGLTIVPVVRANFERGDPVRKALIDEFIARRLLTAEEADGVARVRPVHEALLRVVPDAVAIIKENAALIRVRHTLDPMVAEWARAPAQNKDDFLATSPALIAGAVHLVDRFGSELSADMRDYIAASLAADEARRNAERARQRRITAATMAGLVVALSLAGVAGWKWLDAAEQKRNAEVQRGRAENALTVATRAADSLIFDLAREFRGRSGMPIDLVRLILERVQELQKQLAESGERPPDLRRLEAVAHDELHATYLALGDTKSAIASAERARAIFEELAKRSPTQLGLQRDVAVAINNLADARHAADADWNAGLGLYRQSLEIVERLAAARPGDAQYQNDLAVTLNKIADMLFSGGLREESLRTYRRARDVAEKLVKAEPDNLRWRAGLAFTIGRIGLLLSLMGQNVEALAEYNAAAALNEALVKAEPDSSVLQRSLFFAISRVSLVLSTLGRHEEAIANARRGLTIIEPLAKSDSANMQWQRDLAIAYDQYGDALRTARQPTPAIDAYRRSIGIREKLVALDATNLPWRTELANTYIKLGPLLAEANDHDGALAIYRNLLALRELPNVMSDVSVPRDRAYAHHAIGTELAALGRRQEAIDAFRKSLAIVESYARGTPDVAQYQIELVAALFQLALAGDQPRARIERALSIARALESEGRLPASQKFWIEYLEKALAALPG